MKAPTRLGVIASVIFFSVTALPNIGWAQFWPEPVGYSTTRSYPYSLVGRISVIKGKKRYIGSGTVIRPRSVVTCAHVLWSPSKGWARNTYFDRALYGSSYASRRYASRQIILGGYTSNARKHGVRSAYTFSRDLGGLRFTTALAGGGYAGWWADTTLLTGSTYNMILGYGGERHDGKRILKASPAYKFYYQHEAYYLNNWYRGEGGMSGGPVFAWTNGEWYVCAVHVSSGDGNAGVRAFDQAAAKFIRKAL